MMVAARNHAAERRLYRTVFQVLAGAYFGLARLLEVGLHFYPFHIADAAFFVDGLQTAVGIFGLAQRGHSGGMQAVGGGGIHLGQKLSRADRLSVLHRHLGERTTQKE